MLCQLFIIYLLERKKFEIELNDVTEQLSHTAYRIEKQATFILHQRLCNRFPKLAESASHDIAFFLKIVR